MLKLANVIHSTLTYNANLGPAQAQIKALTGQIATLTAAFNTLDKAALKTQAALSSTFLANAGGVGGFTTQVVKASSSVDNFGQALSKQRLTMRQYFREAIAGYTKQNSLMKQLAMQQVRMQQSMAVPIGGGQAALMTPTAVSMTNMASKTALAAQKFSIFNELVQGGSTRLLNFGKNTQWTGRQLMVGFTLPLILFTAVISKQFREIDKELTRFEKVYGSDLVDTVDGSSKRMREAVKELAFEISGAYGIAAKDTAALAADIAATGKEGQALLDSVKQTTRLSVLGEVERQEAMQATLSIQNAFKLNTLELAESIDFLNAVENQTSTTLQDLAGAIPRVGPVIQSLGGDIKDLSVLLVAMREGGVSAAEAANALKSGLGRMINPTRQAKEVASSFGVSLDSIVQNSRGELLPMIFGLQDALSGLDEFARAQVIEKIFGKYQFARMSALFANLRRQGSQTLTVMELASASSTQLASIANQELRALQESTAMRFQRTIENLKNSLIPLGQTLTETLIPILSGIGSGIKGFMEFFQSLPQPLKDFTKLAVAITALAGPVVMLVGLFGNLVANGIKFGMMLVRLSAKMVGMRFEKFELLTKDVMEARLSVDMLTDGFEMQEVALRRLTGVIQGYANALRTSIPAAGSIVAPMPMGARPGAMPLPVYRRQKGSTGPEFVPGSGRGDKIPAMLEPGEFVVNRKATEKFGPILVEMNRGNVQGFQDGMDEKYVKAHLAPSLQVPAGTLLAQPGLAPGTRDILSKIPATQLVTTFNNLVVALKHATNSALNTGNAMASTVAAELKTSQAWSLIMNQTGLDMKQLQPVIDSVTGRLANLGNELIDDPQLYAIVEQSLRELAMAADPAAKVLQTLSRQYGAYAVPGNRQQRQDLGVGIAPSYRGSGDPRVGPKVQSMPFVDLRAGGVPVSPASAMPTGARFGGLESISNAQKIATAEKSILNYTKMQESFAQKRGIALRDMAEVTAQIKQLEDKHRKGQVTFAEFERRRQQLLVERNRLAEDIKKSEMMEKKYQDRITSTTGRIASIEERRAAIAASTNRRLDAVAAMAAKGARSDINARPGATGPSAALLAAKDSGSRGGGLMNAAFMGSMAISSVAMLGGASSEAAMKIGAFSTALMMATMMLQSVSAKGMFTNFLGMGALGGKISGAAGNRAAQAAVSGAGPTVASSLATRQVGVVAKHAPGGLAPLGGGLATLGRGVSVLGGPVGMAAAAAITAGIAGYMAYRNAAEEARERAVAAFADPAKTAEYFGISVEDVTEKLKGVSAALPGIEEIDQALRDSVKQDYAGLIEKIRFSGAQGGARELAVVFNKMLASGLSAEQAEEAVKAIAMESGAAGGAAYAEGMRQGFFAEKDAAQVAQSMADLYNPEGQQKNIAAAQQALTTLENRVGEMGRMGGALAQNLDNTFGDFMTGYASYGANIGNSILSGFTGIDLRDVAGPFDMIFDKDKAQGTIDLLANTERQIHQMQTNIEEMADVTGDSVVKITEVMFQNFQKAPEETIKAFRDIAAAGKRSSAVAFDTQPIKDFIAEIDPISGTILNAMIGEDEDMAMMVQEALISGMSVTEIIETITNAIESGGDIKAELQAEVDLQVKEANITNEITKLRDELKEDLVLDLDLQIEEEEENLEKVNKQLERMDAFRARHEGVLKKEMNRLNRQSEDAIDGMESEIDAIRDRADARKEDFDERMEEYNKEKEQIEESADAYIDSLRKRERADTFYSNQRKTAFSALQKLAAGDVFGFLQEREQMSADAQTFAYDNTIQSIEDKRDREIDTIDEVMEKEQERQEDYEKKVEDRIELIENQIDAEKDLMDERQKNFDREMRFFDRKEKRRRTDLENEKKEVQVSLDQLRATREMAEAGTLVDQKELSKALGEEKAKPYFEEQKAILKTEMMKKYLEMKDKYPDETSAQLQMRAHGELVDLFNALYGVTPGGGRRPTMGWAAQLEDIGFTPEFNAGGEVIGPGTATSDSIPARLSNGEYVIRASSVKKYGAGLMEAINTQKFAEGGPVELKNSLSKWIPKDKLSFYSNWDGYGSWPGGKPSGIMMHHTAGVGPGVLEWMARNPDAGKPVVQAMVARDGVAHILAYGGTGWGAGAGGTEGSYAADIWNNKEYAGLKEDLKNLGGASTTLWQIEVESQGLKKDFTAGMFDTIARMSAAIKEYAGWPSFAGKIINHKDWAAASGPNRPGGQRGDTLYPLGLYQSNANSVWEQGGGSTSEGTKPGKGGGAGGTKDVGGRYMPAMGGSGSNTQFGRATPMFVSAMQLPGKGEGGGGGGGKPGGNGGGTPTGNVTFRNIPDGYTVEDANRTLGYIKSGGWPSSLQRLGWTIAMRESGGRNIYDTGDYGIFQLNKPSYGTQPWWTSDKKIQYDPVYNSSVAYRHVSSSGKNFLPWAMRVNKNGGYEWDWSYYNPRPSWADATERRTAAFWNSWVQKAAGGYISGAGGPMSDSIPAMLSNGEYVIRADSVKKYGKDFLDSINSGRFGSTTLALPEPEMAMSAAAGGFIGMARGGMIGSPSFKIPSNKISTVNVKENVMAANSSANTVNNSSNVKIVINGAGKNAKSIANKVMEAINNSENARNHSRSIR